MTEGAWTALGLLNHFRSVDEHIGVLVGAIPRLRDPPVERSRSAATALITSLIRRGLVISHEERLSQLLSGARRSPAPFAGIVIRGCDRPAQVEALLGDLASEERRHGLHHPILFIDDSRTMPARAKHRELLDDVRRRLDVDTTYFGEEETRQYVCELARALPHCADMLGTLYFRRRPGFGGGRTLNLALLLTAGRRLAMLDDDFRFPLHRWTNDSGEGGDGVEGGEADDESSEDRVRFLPDAGAALAAGAALGVDGVCAHLDIAGRSLSGALRASAELRTVVRSPRGRTLNGPSLLRADAVVVATYNGFRGASGADTSASFLGLGPNARRALWTGRAAYRRHMQGNAIWWTRWHATIGRAGMFLPFAIDNSRPLACTSPDGRGEDGLFGMLLHYVYPDDVTVHLPWSVGHRQAEPRRRYEQTFVAPLPSINRFLRDWIDTAARHPATRNPAERLGVLASQLDDLACAPDRVVLDTLTGYVRFLQAERLEWLWQQLEAANDAPAYWVADIRRMMRITKAVLLNARVGQLSEWPESVEPGEACRLLRKILQRFAVGCRHWVDVWTCAASMPSVGPRRGRYVMIHTSPRRLPRKETT